MAEEMVGLKYRKSRVCGMIYFLELSGEGALFWLILTKDAKLEKLKMPGRANL